MPKRDRVLTRAPGSELARCELTYLERRPIDVERAAEQHADYRRALREVGLEVEVLPPAADGLPDAVFVEDAAVVLDEMAVVARPQSASRRSEVGAVAEALARYRALRSIEPPGTLEGGDVLRLGRRLFLGLSRRTDAEGARQLAAIAEPLGYSTTLVPVSGCLHLKTAVTAVDPETVLLNPAWVDPAAFAGLRRLEVSPREPFAANTLAVQGILVVSASWPRTREALVRRGHRTRAVAIDEIEKAEAGLTCLSLVVGGSVAP